MSESNYILSVPETGATRELTGEQLRGELASGVITPEHWVWSPEHNDWKQISELPALLAAPVPAAIPVPAFVPTTGQTAAIPAVRAKTPVVAVAPVTAATPAGATGALPMGVGPLGVKAMPKVEPMFVPEAAAPAVKKRKLINTSSVHVEYDHFPWVKFFFESLYIGIAVIIGLNYIVVDKPLNEALAHTPFILVPVHAHMGSFVQPNAMVVHLLPTAELTNDNLPDFLQTLAASTPNQPFNADARFQMVELTSGWLGQYSISGENWRKLGEMSKVSSIDRRDFISDSLCTLSGQPMIRHAARDNPIDLKAARDQTWHDFTALMLKHA